MRDYGSVSPSYWNGQTGREIRAMGQAAQLVGVYLLTCPHSNLIGLYYLPLALLAHETNCGLEEAHQIMKALADLDWAYYDCGSETVWVRNMAFYQVAEEVKRTDKRWPAVVRELVSNSKSPFFSRFVDVYRVPFNLAEALEAPSEPLGSPSQAPSKGLKRAARKQRQAPPEVADIPPENHQKPLGSPLEAPSQESQTIPATARKPLGSPSYAKEQGTRNREQGTRNKEQERIAAPPPGPVPPFLAKDLQSMGVKRETWTELFNRLGRHDLRCALYKLSTKADGKNRAGLLIKKAAELAKEGHEILAEEARTALAASPKALKDPRWVKQPAELRDDLEVQAAWAKWHRAEAHMLACPGDDEAPRAERAIRRPLVELLAERHPDQAAFAALAEQDRACVGVGALTPATVRLLALSRALGLADVKEGKA